jgi:hypothetical protein
MLQLLLPLLIHTCCLKLPGLLLLLLSLVVLQLQLLLLLKQRQIEISELFHTCNSEQSLTRIESPELSDLISLHKHKMLGNHYTQLSKQTIQH